MKTRTIELHSSYFAGIGGGGDFAKPDGTSEPHNFSKKGQGPWKSPSDVQIVAVTVVPNGFFGGMAVQVKLASPNWPEGDDELIVCPRTEDEIALYRKQALKEKRKRAAKKRSPKK